MPLIYLTPTANFTVGYDSVLSTTGAALAQGVWDYCEYDLTRLSLLFGGILPPPASLPIAIEIRPSSATQGGGSNNGSNLITVYLDATWNPADVPALVVAELAEIFMAFQSNGWVAAWSNGEALSKLSACLLYPNRAFAFMSSSSWLNSSRPDWVSNVEHTDGDYVSSGCGTLFLNYLAYQLNKRWTDIVQAGAPTTRTLAETASLVGVPNAFTAWNALITSHFPPGTNVFPHTDDVYPLGPVPTPTPTLFMRHNTADDGTSHAPPLSSSPDIIVRGTAVADPQTTFSTAASLASATESDGAVLDGGPNHVYLRVFNRGAAAKNVFATVYWAEPATLVTPDAWNLLGSAYFPDVPSGSSVRVSNPGVLWPKDRIPAAGHYCFVATVGNADDPPPTPSTFATFDDFVSYIAANNNIVWRNFNVVHVAAAVHGRSPFGLWVPLPFRIAGAWDRHRVFSLETVAALPEGSRFALQVPEWIARGLEPQHFDLEKHGDPVTDPKNPRRARVSLAPHRRHHLGEIELAPKASAPSHLLVHIPDEMHLRPHEVAVRQLYKGREVGRITWLLVPEKHAKKA